MKNTKYFENLDGRIFAKLNWQFRKKDDDVLVFKALNKIESMEYEELIKEGHDEKYIFNFLFPQKVIQKGKQVSIKIEELNKKQISNFISEKLKISLSSLNKMSKEDLIKLYITLDK